MYKVTLVKPDGRALMLYACRPIPPTLEAPSPSQAPLAATSHLRWHPLRGEWVAYAGHRQHRTFLPPAEYNPLAPTRDPSHPTELPQGPYDIAVFENLFPTFLREAGETPQAIVPTRPGHGACEVVVYTQDPHTTLAALPLWHLELLVDVWADRYAELGARDDVQYVFIFENRGVEVGVTLPHPHGQIYAFPFIPPVAARELAEQQAYLDRNGRGLLEDHLAAELADSRRLLVEQDEIVAFVPACARYSYEVWIAPRRPAPSIVDLSRSERRALARALKIVLLKFDRLWSRPFPYVMVFHQAPTDGRSHPEAHLHIEFYPAYRMPGRLKYLAGSELGAGTFTADTLPEDKARELQAVEVTLDDDDDTDADLR